VPTAVTLRKLLIGLLGAQAKSRDATGEIEADLTAYRHWLQRHSPVGSTDQNIWRQGLPRAPT
jgi:hypothetical protein